MKREKIRKIYGSITVAMLLIIPFLASVGVVRGAEYSLALSKNTQHYDLIQYDEDTWDDVVNSSINPSDWFGGDADEVNAKSKQTVKGWFDRDWKTYDAFNTLFVPQELLVLLISNESLEYTEDEVNENYDDTYQAWVVYTAKWDFTSDEFEIDPDDENERMVIFQDGESAKKLLDTYNEWVADINPKLAFYFQSLPIISGDEFLWELTRNMNLGFAQPFSEQMSEIVEELDCDNVKVDGNQLVFERKEKEEFNVIFTFEDGGRVTEITVEDADGSSFYKITSSSSSTFAIVMVIISIIAVGAAIAYLVYKRKQRTL